MMAELVYRQPCQHGNTTKNCDRPVCTACAGVWEHEAGCRFSGFQGTTPCPGGSEIVLDPDKVLFEFDNYTVADVLAALEETQK